MEDVGRQLETHKAALVSQPFYKDLLLTLGGRQASLAAMAALEFPNTPKKLKIAIDLLDKYDYLIAHLERTSGQMVQYLNALRDKGTYPKLEPRDDAP